MSRFWLRSVLCALLLAAGIGAGAAGVAGAASIDSLLSGALQPSSTPALLGPITEAGRKGWACKPEQAAAARSAREADLPSAMTQ